MNFSHLGRCNYSLGIVKWFFRFLFFLFFFFSYLGWRWMMTCIMFRRNVFSCLFYSFSYFFDEFFIDVILIPSILLPFSSLFLFFFCPRRRRRHNMMFIIRVSLTRRYYRSTYYGHMQKCVKKMNKKKTQVWNMHDHHDQSIWLLFKSFSPFGIFVDS